MPAALEVLPLSTVISPLFGVSAKCFSRPTVGNYSPAVAFDAVALSHCANQVQMMYDDFGQLITEYQSHDGAVNVLTPLMTSPVGIPTASVIIDRFVPCLPRSVGFFPVISPPNGDFVMAASTLCKRQSRPTSSS